MKPLLATIAGFVLSLGMFIGGVVVAASFLGAEPARPGLNAGGVADAWSAHARAVDVASQEFERIPARTRPYERADAAPVVNDGEPEEIEVAMASIDEMTTAALQPEPEPEPAPAETDRTSQLRAAHDQWCNNRYRSYRASDSSYQPYNGGRRACRSPHYQDLVNAGVINPNAIPPQEPVRRAPQVQRREVQPVQRRETVQAAAQPERRVIRLTAEHVNYCFARYNSYRVSDNSYQPYGGGPRRQCR